MTDDSGRRERRQFEPPPWERDKYDEIARRKAEDDEPEAQRQAPRSEGPAPDRPAEPASIAGPAVTTPPAEVVADKPPAAGIDERKIAAMLIELSGEEGPPTKPMAQAGRYVAMALIAFGVVMIVTAVVLGMRASALQGRVGAILIALLGGFVAGFAGWMWVRANREQGS
jgi:hypothetical protein